MTDVLSHLVDAPIANILILAGLAFLAIGVLGKISGKIEPNTTGRILSGLLGLILLIYGIYNHAATDAAPNQPNPTPIAAGRRPPRPVKPAPAGISGDWKNDNPQTRGITRLEVRQSGDLVAVHAWGACSPHDCDWGSTNGPVQGQSASVTWDQGFVLRKMTLVADGERLRMALDSVYRDNRQPQNGVEYFVRNP